MLEFRTRNKTNRIIKLLDANDTKGVIGQHGKMGLIKHNNILSALEMDVLRYRNKGRNKVDMDDVIYKKKDKAAELIDDLQADLVAHCEHKMRVGHKLNQNRMRQMFNGRESDMRTVTGSNDHDNGGGAQ